LYITKPFSAGHNNITVWFSIKISEVCPRPVYGSYVTITTYKYYFPTQY